MRVTLTATSGLILSGTTGLSFEAGGNGAASMTFTGDIMNINVALSCLRYVTFGSGSPGSVTITTNDLGQTGAGGALSDTDTVTITLIWS
jgi:hypothetical protein